MAHQNASGEPACLTWLRTQCTSLCSDGGVGTWQRTQPLPATEQPPSGWTSARPEGTQPVPGTKQPPCRWTCACRQVTQPLPATVSSRPH